MKWVGDRKTNMSYPLIRTCMYAYQGARNVSFSEKFNKLARIISMILAILLFVMLWADSYYQNDTTKF